MNFSIFATADATLYELHSKRNSGIDQILELEKITPNIPDMNGEYWDSIYNSRFIIKFDTRYIRDLINTNIIDKTAKYFLTVRATEALELPISYTIEAYPLAMDWVNGQGHYNDFPEFTTGVSWEFTDGYFFNSGTRWISGSYPSGTTGSYSKTPGGGLWYSHISGSQTLDYVSVPDLRMEVTSIVHAWLSGSIPNFGFVVKYNTDLEESNTDVGALKFFSRDSHTVYLPKLEAQWNDAQFISTGSLPEVGSNFMIHFNNLRNQYKSISKEIFRVSARDLAPTPTYSTSSRFLNLYRLPVSSYYAVQDSITTEFIIPFNTGSTQLSCDSSGNFFRLDMRTFLPDRYYKFLIKTIRQDGLVEQIFDEGYYFKVVR